MLQPKSQTLNLISNKFKKAYRGNLQRKATSTLKCSMVMSSGRWQLLWVHTVVECSRYIFSLRGILKLLCNLLCQILHWSLWYVLARVSTQTAGHGFDGFFRVFHVLELFRQPFTKPVLLHIGEFSLFRRVLPHCVKSPCQRPKHVTWDATLLIYLKDKSTKGFLTCKVLNSRAQNQCAPSSVLSYSFFEQEDAEDLGGCLVPRPVRFLVGLLFPAEYSDI